MTLVVVPAYIARDHEAAQLQRCLGAVLTQLEVEGVVVVDDASPLPLPALPSRVELLRLAVNSGPAAARNAGLARALERGARSILFTDVDCVPDPGWAAALLARLEAGSHAAVGGVTRSLGATLLDRYHDFAGTLNGRWALPARESLFYATTCNLAVRGEAVRTLRFDERFPTAAGEDTEFCHRLRGVGTIGFAPTAVVRHDFAYRSTLRGLPSFLRLFRRYGEADPLLWAVHPELRSAQSEACAAADLLAHQPPADPTAYRRGAIRRVRPARFRPALVLLKRLARWAYKAGQRRPRPFRTSSEPRPLARGPEGG